METMMTLWQTLQRLEVHLAACADAQGLDADQAVLLGAFSENPDLEVRGFARALRLPRPKLEAALSRLEAQGLLERIDRAVLVTDAGKAKLEAMRAALDPDSVLIQFCVSWIDLCELLHELQTTGLPLQRETAEA